MMRHEQPATSTTDQALRDILDVLTQLRDGSFGSPLNEEHSGARGEIAKVLNEHLAFLRAYRDEHLRLMEETGVSGRLGGQLELPEGMPEWRGDWKHMANATNRMVGNLTWTIREDAKTVSALARGDENVRAFDGGGIQGEFHAFRQSIRALTERS